VRAKDLANKIRGGDGGLLRLRANLSHRFRRWGGWGKRCFP
jgi:hypothetical protein